MDDIEVAKFMAAIEVQEKIESGEIPIDLNGHFENHKLRYDDSCTPWNDKHIIQSIARAISYQLRGYPELGKTLLDCSHCGQKIEAKLVKGKVKLTKKCKYPNGYPAYEFELNVPSGKMVVGNDFRGLFPVVGTYYINNIIGCAKTTQQYAKAGLAHAFVGNTCPGLFKVNDKSFVIGVQGRNNPIKGAKRVAGVCTDLWWYSIADYDEYVKRTGEKPEDVQYVDVVKCEPGVYKFKHQYHLVQDKYPAIYTYVNWVKPAQKVKDYLSKYTSLNYTAEQIIAQEVATWSKNAIAAADRIMCVIGSGSEHHPNGWFSRHLELPPNAPAVKIPIFKEKFRWYPFSENHSPIGEAVFGYRGGPPLYLNESFTALAFNILQCVLRYGVEERVPTSQGASTETQKVARKIFDGLVKMYPDRVPEYCRDLVKIP